MIVIDPNDSTHDLYLIPRYYDTGTALRVLLRDENTRGEETLTPNTETLVDEYLQLNITKTAIEGNSYSVKVYDSDNDKIYWRGRIYTTAQVPQQYKLNG